MPIFLSYVFLLIAALIFAGIGVIFAFLGEKACLSKQCVGQAKFINHAMRKNLNPCDDFYSFACDKFPQYGYSIIDEIERKQFNRLVNFLEVPADWETDQRVEHIAKSLYQTCMNDTELDREGLKPLYRVLYRLGGIPFLDPLWEYEMKADFKIVDTELKHFYNGLNSLFVYVRIIRLKVYPEDKPKNKTLDEIKKKLYHVITIPPNLYNDLPPDPEKYLSYCMQFNDLYSSQIETNKTITEKEKQEIKDAANFKINLLKILDRSKNCSDQPFHVVDLPYDKPFGRKDPSTGERTNRVLEYIYRKAQPGDTVAFRVLITPGFEKFIDDLNKLFDTVSDRVLATYMGVEALIQLTPFLPKQFRAIYNEYLSPERDKHNSILSKRSYHCAKVVKDAMTTALTTEYLMKAPPPPEVAVLNAMIIPLKKQVLKMLLKAKWPSKKDKRKMFRLVNEMEIVSPLPPSVMEMLMNKTAFEFFYVIMCVNDDSTLETYLAVKGVRMIRNTQLLNKVTTAIGTTIAYSVFNDEYDVFDTDIYYHQDSNSIVVPMAYLYYPSLDYLWPKYLSYGGLAVWIARLIMKTAGYSNVIYPEMRPNPDTPASPDWWDHQTVSSYKEKRLCTLNRYNKYLKQFGVKCDDANCLDETLYYTAAVEAAFNAYEEITRARFFVEPRIPYLTRYTVNQIFFIKYASSFCEYEGPAPSLYKNDLDSAKVSSNFTVLYSLRNFPKFSEAFRCGPGDKMTAVKLCDVWPSAEE